MDLFDTNSRDSGFRLMRPLGGHADSNEREVLSLFELYGFVHSQDAGIEENLLDFMRQYLSSLYPQEKDLFSQPFATYDDLTGQVQLLLNRLGYNMNSQYAELEKSLADMDKRMEALQLLIGQIDVQISIYDQDCALKEGTVKIVTDKIGTLTRYKEQIKQLRTDSSDIQKRIRSQDTSLRTLEKTLGELTREHDTYTSETQRIEARTEELYQFIERVQNLPESNASYLAQLEAVERNIESLSAEIEVMEDLLESPRFMMYQELLSGTIPPYKQIQHLQTLHDVMYLQIGFRMYDAVYDQTGAHIEIEKGDYVALRVAMPLQVDGATKWVHKCAIVKEGDRELPLKSKFAYGEMYIHIKGE